MNFILYKYIARIFLNYVVVVFISLAGVVLFFDAIELFKLSVKVQGISIKQVLWMALLRNYYHANKVWPFVILLSSLFTYRKMSHNSELYALRSSGFSTVQLIAPVMIAALFVGILHITILNPLGSYAVERYQHMEATQLQSGRSLISFFGSGLWLKQNDLNSKGEVIFHAMRISQVEQTFYDVTFFYNDQDYSFIKRIDAKKAQIQNKRWVIKDARVTDYNYKVEYFANLYVPTEFTFEGIMDGILSPEILSFWKLLEFLFISNKSGVVSFKHQIYFGRLMCTPVFFSTIVMLGYIFGVGRVRDLNSHYKVAVALLTQFLIYFLSDFVSALSVVGMLSTIIGSLFPFVISSIIGIYMILHFEFS